MTRQEARQFLFTMKHVLADAGHLTLAWAVEDAEARVAYLSLSDLRIWARIALPAGRRGRAMLLLQSPYDARVLALLFGVLMSVEDEPMDEAMRAILTNVELRSFYRLVGKFGLS